MSILFKSLLKILFILINEPTYLSNIPQILRRNGLRGSIRKALGVVGPEYKFTSRARTREIDFELANFKKKPLISILMPVYNVDPIWLSLAIDSVKNQFYENWELCIADDCSTNLDTITFLKSLNDERIKIIFLEKNLNISGASNEAFKLSSGDYIALLDNDDELTSDALYEIVKVINDHNPDFIYSDECRINPAGIYCSPIFKPDFSPDLLLTHNYITHFVTIKREVLVVGKFELFHSRFDGAQDYDLFLRVTELTNKIYHIPKVLYGWRMIVTSTSMNSASKPWSHENGKKALEEATARRKIIGEVLDGNIPHFFRLKRTILDAPKVSIVIPFKDQSELLKGCIGSIIQKSTYANYEILGINNGSVDPKTFLEIERLKKADERIRFFDFYRPFNYSQINNWAVNLLATGEHIILLNNDVEIISKDWIESLLEFSLRSNIGCVGGKLFYPNDKIQHAGIIIGIGGSAGHGHKNFGRKDLGYLNKLNAPQNVSAVTGACLMVKKELYQRLGGLDEVKFKVAFNDVDFCLRVLKKGYFNVFTPYCEAYHYESLTRGYDDSVEKKNRLEKEIKYLKENHYDVFQSGDKFYNPNLTLEREDYSFK